MRSIVIGNFDGVHLGHRALLARARQVVGAGGTVSAVTFDPHPRTLLTGQSRDAILSLNERKSCLLGAGADSVEVVPMDDRLLNKSPVEFIEQLLSVGSFESIVEGADFRFGVRQSGDISELIRIGKNRGFSVDIVENITVIDANGNTQTPRTSTILEAIKVGNLDLAALLLGRRLSLEGVVVQGDARGRTIGFPTANIQVRGIALPPDGIYAATASRNGGPLMPAAVHIGPRPAVGDYRRAIEAAIIGDIGPVGDYGWTLRIEWIEYLRPIVHFSDLHKLSAQISEDLARAKEVVSKALKIES